MPASQNEAFSRVLIDKALEFSGWNLLDSREVRFEINGQTGRLDYVLTDTPTASRQRLEALFQSMFHRAFNGEL